ncbi:MAG: hypothetical protein ABSC37_15735 [Xanthobacteraceae bacterium]
MSDLPVRAQHSAHAWLRRGFTRVIAAVDAVFDVFAEAQDQSSAARERFPSAD